MAKGDDSGEGDKGGQGPARVLPIGGRAGRRKAQAAGCALCGKPVDPHYRPFCSRRCADLDLHRWLSGSYRVPTDERPDEGEAGAGVGRGEGEDDDER